MGAWVFFFLFFVSFLTLEGGKWGVGFFYKTFSFLSFLFFIVCKFIVSFLTLEGGGKGQMGFLKLLYLLGQRRRRERVGGFSQGFFF